jgi:hypothetical protein
MNIEFGYIPPLRDQTRPLLGPQMELSAGRNKGTKRRAAEEFRQKQGIKKRDGNTTIRPEHRFDNEPRSHKNVH